LLEKKSENPFLIFSQMDCKSLIYLVGVHKIELWTADQESTYRLATRRQWQRGAIGSSPGILSGNGSEWTFLPRKEL
jgi:hypothetical protein